MKDYEIADILGKAVLAEFEEETTKLGVFPTDDVKASAVLFTGPRKMNKDYTLLIPYAARYLQTGPKSTSGLGFDTGTSWTIHTSRCWRWIPTSEAGM